MTINRDIRDAAIRHAIWLERYKSGEVARVLKALNSGDKEIIADIAAGLADITERGYDLSDESEKKVTALIEKIKAKRGNQYREAAATATDDLKELAVYEAGFAAKIITDAAAGVVDLRLSMPPASQIHAAVTKKPFQGRLLREWFSGLESADARRISDAVRIGIIDGRTTDQIVRAIRGTRALGYSDGILEISRRDARSVVRTATAHVSARAKEDLYAANDDIILGEQWVSVLDMRTTSGCAALDGQIFDVGQGPKVPRHFGCRSVRVPYLGETSIEGTRASKFGPVPESTNYEQWLKSQSPQVQDEVLGAAKGKLFREGSLPLERFVDGTGREYNLQQLRDRDRGVFDSVFAGGTPDSPATRAVREAEFKEYLGSKTYERLRSGVDEAMRVSGVSGYGLSEAERVAIHAYTTGDKYYDRLNSALRSNNAEAIARVAPMASVLDRAIDKLPVYQGAVVFRVTDLPEAVAKKVKAGNVYSDPAFMSASKVDMGSTFGADYRFTIVRSQQGREIAGFSSFPHEQEVLFPRRTSFDILKASKDNKTGFNEVTLSDAE